MAISLPALPQGSQTNFKFKSNFLDLTPSFGGKTQRVARLGDRFSVEVVAQPMRGDQGAAFVSQLNLGITQKVLMNVPQALAVGSPGFPLVSTASQSGQTLALKGLSTNYGFKAGQFISIITGGVRYLHQVTANTTAAGTTVTIPIIPMLRISPAANDVVEVATPKIEGFLSGNSNNWAVDYVTSVGLTFSVEEAA